MKHICFEYKIYYISVFIKEYRGEHLQNSHWTWRTYGGNHRDKEMCEWGKQNFQHWCEKPAVHHLLCGHCFCY